MQDVNDYPCSNMHKDVGMRVTSTFRFHFSMKAHLKAHTHVYERTPHPSNTKNFTPFYKNIL